jgi:RNA polymerase sigma-70 factor (ECF subfamily)
MFDSGELSAWAVAALGPVPGGADAPIPESWLASIAAAAQRVRASHPDYVADLGTFFARLGSLLADGQPREQALSGVCVEDLYLAYATSSQETSAIIALKQEMEPELRAALGRLRVPARQHDDLRQRLWIKLLVGGDHPKILDYSGRGKLRYWFRVTAVRFLLDDLRVQKGPSAPTSEEVDEIASPLADPELELLKRKYSQEFTSAFEQATVALSPEDRNVLRSYYAKQMTIDEIATAFGIHRATAARRVHRAREALLSDTRRRLAEQLRLTHSELDSVLRLIESRMQVSVHRLLG